jgi:DNA-binding MarR family transcriptional regulator
MAKAPRTFYLIGQLNAAVRLRLERILRDFDLTVAQYTAMSRIKGREVLSSAKLARAHHVSPQTMNELIGNLEARGLVARREDPENRRVLLVALTESGRELLAQCDRTVDELEGDFFASVDAADLASLRKILERLIAETRHAAAN